MENHQIVRRRANVIAAHLVSHEDISASATHVFPMSCRNSLNSVRWRCDNRMYFARQGSSSQGCFMRQASSELGFCGQHNTPSKSTSCGIKGSSSFEGPMFSKPAQAQTHIRTVKENHSSAQNHSYTDPPLEAPLFARPNPKSKCGQPQSHSDERQPQSHSDESNDMQDFAPKKFNWSPRMNVEESGFNYYVTLEIPGVSIDTIKVEVDDKSLIATGARSTVSSAVRSCSNKSAPSYHKQEIIQGPYRVIWPLPSNANKENVSAEIQDGLLRITIPKLSGLRWLRKEHM